MSQFCCKSLGRPEFNIGRNTLSLIYSQGLIWLGTFYCPLLPVIMAFKLLVIFYVKRVSTNQYSLWNNVWNLGGIWKCQGKFVLTCYVQMWPNKTEGMTALGKLYLLLSQRILKGYSLSHDLVAYIQQKCWPRVLKVDESTLAPAVTSRLDIQH